MAIREVEVMINDLPHIVQVNDADVNGPAIAGRIVEKSAKVPANKERIPRNKAAKPAVKASQVDASVEEASDLDASE